LGLSPAAITLLIATGAHAPLAAEEFERVLPAAIIARYPVRSHDCDDEANLRYLGQTRRGTPVWMNRLFVEAELRLVVGNVEPHQFQGFSGGGKSAAIGLGGPATINANHALLRDPRARPCAYADNPMRQDVEEIGQLAGIHFALNAVLTPEKALAHAVAGAPRAVMESAMPLARAIFEVAVVARYDLIIVAAGGHPKDLQLYQAQKALAHASLAVKEQGLIILVAACPEGLGSREYERWMLDHGPRSIPEVFARFEQEGFRVGPHKALLLARDVRRLRGVWLVSEMPPSLVQQVLLTPASLDEALRSALELLPSGARIGVMPVGNATVPRLEESAMD
jgi:nickel-dependent lactate racemase